MNDTFTPPEVGDLPATWALRGFKVCREAWSHPGDPE